MTNFLLFFVLFGAVLANNDLRLPKSVVPDSYELWITPFIWDGNFTFNGEVRIVVNVTSDCKNVTLHAHDVTIDDRFTTISHYNLDEKNKNNETLRIVEQQNDTKSQFYIIQTQEILEAGKQYLLSLKYTGEINNDLEGFYRSHYTENNQTKWIALTHFEPTGARRAFPCFDEPAMKATFQINIARPKNMSSISNMPKENESLYESLPDYVWDHYQRSVPMSTYLVAFVVSDFSVVKSKTNTRVSVWARKDAIEEAYYSLEIASIVLKYFEDYFNIEYPLPKLDMIALPDFDAGAMENWGLITYRESGLLIKENVSTTQNKQYVVETVSHELAHQWFGNLVTPNWWTDLWLNEGFATYVSYIGTKIVDENWKPQEVIIVEDIQVAMNLDALESSHQISIKVNDPAQINEIFDDISYSKGASVIRMMNDFLTTKVFTRGLTNYLREKTYESAEQDDLWNALTIQAHQDNVLEKNITVKQIMDTWTLQTGFPVVTVVRNYTDNSAQVTQSRFMLINDTNENQESTWWIPLTYTTSKKLNFNDTKPAVWMKTEKNITIANIDAEPQEWIIFNILESGFYRVNYDKNNWQLIINQLKEDHTKISTINRAQLVDDVLNLARAERLDYGTSLDVVSYIVNETDYVPWKSFFTALNYVDQMLVQFENYDAFKAFVLKLLDNVYKKIGFKDAPEDPHLMALLRVEVLKWACKFDHEDCVKDAVHYFEMWRNSTDPNNDNPISPDLKSTVYCTAVRTGDETVWNFLWQRYKECNIGSEKNRMLYGLGCSRNTSILTKYVDLSLTKNSGIRKQDIQRVFNSLSENNVGQPLIFKYMIQNWKRIIEYFGVSNFGITKIYKACTGYVSTVAELEELEEFSKELGKFLGSTPRTIEQAKEKAKANIRWTVRNNKVIQNWLNTEL